MKPFLLLLSLLISVPVFSQHYRTVLVDKEVYYDFQSNFSWEGLYRMVKLDSISVIGNDTIIHHQFNFEFREQPVYDSIMQNYNSCYISADTGFLGYKTILQSNGMDIYFNNNDDSIFVNTQANLNDTWTFFTYPNGDYFEAKVTLLKKEYFLGTMDSIKVITIQAMDNLGNPIIGSDKTIELRISKHYGIMKGFNLFHFPIYSEIQYFNSNHIGSISIEGIQEVNIGVNDFTAADVYDFDVGDEFHRMQIETQVYTKMFINNKSYSINNDTVFYGVTLHKVRVDGYFLDTIFWGDTTIFYDVSPNHFLNTKTLNYSDDTILVMLSDANNYPFYRNKLAKTISDNGAMNTINGCIFVGTPGPGLCIYNYYEGLGNEWDCTSFHFSNSERLVYYKKGNVQSGTPIIFDDVINTRPINENNFPLKIFPNPTNNLLNFQFTEPIQNAEIRIYSSIGQLMLNQNVNDTNMQFDVSNWPRNLGGVYFYGIYVEGEVVKQGQVLIQD